MYDWAASALGSSVLCARAGVLMCEEPHCAECGDRADRAFCFGSEEG